MIGVVVVAAVVAVAELVTVFAVVGVVVELAAVAVAVAAAAVAAVENTDLFLINFCLYFVAVPTEQDHLVEEDCHHRYPDYPFLCLFHYDQFVFD